MHSTAASLAPHSFLQRQLRFWSRHLLLLNVVLFGAAWVFYGAFVIRGWGDEYLRRSQDFWIRGEPWSGPGIENVLLPGLAAVVGHVCEAIGVGFTDKGFMLLAAAPYALFIWGVAAHLRRRARAGRHGLAVASTLALYASGIIPYMASWGGSVDGLAYLAVLPAFIWPQSLLIFTLSVVVQCLNHYAGLIALVLFAVVWHTLRALDHEAAESGFRYWRSNALPRLLIGAGILLAFLWFWHVRYPDLAWVRQSIVKEKWNEPAQVLLETISPFPWTLLSALKLLFVPIFLAMAAPHPRKRLHAMVLAAPLVAGALIVFVFVDVTRMAALMMVPGLLVVLRIAGGDLAMPRASRRRLRAALLVTAALSLLIPNYYVNDGDIDVPRSSALRWLIQR